MIDGGEAAEAAREALRVDRDLLLLARAGRMTSSVWPARFSSAEGG
jgi:hypothetical protein